MDGREVPDAGAVIVPGMPEEVWAAVATGAGITAWSAPCTVEERLGGAVVRDFGGGHVTGDVVTRWEPPRVFGYGDAEFRVEARPGGTCTVHADGDLLNLRLHLTHFPGEECHTVLAGGTASWDGVTAALGLPAAPTEGDWVAAHAEGGPHFGGRVVHVEDGRRIAVLTDLPAPGIVLVDVPGPAASLAGYFRGPTGIDAATAARTAWTSWFARLSQTSLEKFSQ
jgi:uncharacterized protein YndB with AHSA1/START domain